MAESTEAETIVAAKGPKCTVAYARCSNGEMLAKDFLDSNKKLKKAFAPLIQHLADHGRITNDKLFSKMEGMEGVWEFRKGGKRLFCVADGNRWLLTHPYGKGHSRQHQTRAAKQAISIAAEHRAWEAAKSANNKTTEATDDTEG